MSIYQGVELQGVSNGGITPKSFGGLQAWYRSTDDITFGVGTGVSGWKDLSIYGRHLTAINRSTLAPVAAAGNIFNTPNGLAYSNDNGVFGLACLSDYTFKKMLYDGRPMTVIVVFYIRTFMTNTGFRFVSSGILPNGAAGYLQHGAPTANYAIRTLNGSTTIATNDIVNAFTGTGGHVTSLIDIGYDAASSLLHRRAYLEGVEKNKVKFTSAPSLVDDLSAPFSIQSGPQNAIYEIILYDQTGKTEAQILAEHSQLITDYINLRYPNLYTS
jgi:hypothetical protein